MTQGGDGHTEEESGVPGAKQHYPGFGILAETRYDAL